MCITPAKSPPRRACLPTRPRPPGSVSTVNVRPYPLPYHVTWTKGEEFTYRRLHPPPASHSYCTRAVSTVLRADTPAAYPPSRRRVRALHAFSPFIIPVNREPCLRILPPCSVLSVLFSRLTSKAQRSATGSAASLGRLEGSQGFPSPPTPMQRRRVGRAFGHDSPSPLSRRRISLPTDVIV